MKYLRSLILFSVLGLAVFSCEEAPEDIQSTLFDDVGGSGGGGENEDGFYDPSYYFDFTYDSGEDGEINYNEIFGFDFYVENYENSLPLYNVNVTINSVTPSTYITFYDGEPGTISVIYSGSSEKPTNYAWCYNNSISDFVNCYNSSYDIYLGSFVIQTGSGSFDSDININFSISFTYGGVYYTRTYTETVTIEA